MISLFRLAARSLRRTPSFTLTVIATLGIGIGLNAAIFTVVDNVLLRPLGYHEADRIVAVGTRFSRTDTKLDMIGGDNFFDVSKLPGIEATALYTQRSEGLEVQGAATFLPLARVSPRFPQIMGVEPVAGRLFNPADTDGTDVLVSEAFVQQHYASNKAALGQTMLFSGAIRTIVGVVPAGFKFPANAQAWFESPAKPEYSDRSAYSQHMLAKLRPGVSLTQANVQLGVLAKQLAATYPENKGSTFEAVRLKDQLVGDVRPTLKLLMGSVMVILLIVCANITHLQLVRAMREMRSITVRTALGATRGSLAARALVEATILSLLGSITALLLAVPCLRLLLSVAPPSIPRLGEIRLNLDVIAFSFALSLVLMSVTALLPVWRSWHVDPAQAMRQDASRGTEAHGTLRLRNGLIVAEVALTLMLSVAATLLTRQLIAQSRISLGFSPNRLLLLDSHRVEEVKATGSHVPAPGSKEEDEADKASDREGLAHFKATLASIRAVPGVESAEGILGAPMSNGGAMSAYAIKGRNVFGPNEALDSAVIHAMTPGLPATLGVPLLRGRGLSNDDRADTPLVVLINETFAKKVFAGQDPIGQQVMSGYDYTGKFWTIVGVVGDIHNNNPTDVPVPTFYLSLEQHPQFLRDAQVIVSTRAEPGTMTETLRRSLHETHPEVAVKITTMRDAISLTQWSDHFRAVLFASFAAVSILLAAIGMYGVTSYSVAQRRFEFALRIALGADRLQVLTLVLRSGLTVSAIGIVTGVLLSIVATRSIERVVGPLPKFDIVAYGVASLAVAAIALIATLTPARRAAGVEPMSVLRSE